MLPAYCRRCAIWMLAMSHYTRGYDNVIREPSIFQPGDHSERRRILVAPSELEEQRGCAVLAFREWLAPLAFKTERALVVPTRFSTLFNFSAVAAAWKETCGLKDVIYEPGVFAKHYEHTLCAPNSSTSFHVRIEKDWRSGGGGQRPLQPCQAKHAPSKSRSDDPIDDSSQQRHGGEGSEDTVPLSSQLEGLGPERTLVDRCLVLRGRASLFELVKQVPELAEGIPCIVITHAARGFRSKPHATAAQGGTCHRDDWHKLDFTDAYHGLEWRAYSVNRDKISPLLLHRYFFSSSFIPKKRIDPIN